jgi:nitrogen fixation-related uncharacterized protein
MTILLGISVLLNLVFGYVVWNLMKKTERFEDTYVHFFQRVEQILADMRAIDDREMFEKDDEVGTLFTQLTSILGDLRYLIYGTQKEE